MKYIEIILIIIGILLFCIEIWLLLNLPMIEDFFEKF